MNEAFPLPKTGEKGGGRVRCALVGVNVLLKGERIGDATAVDGTFIIPDVAPGAYTLQARALGFATAQRTITVRAG